MTKKILSLKKFQQTLTFVTLLALCLIISIHNSKAQQSPNTLAIFKKAKNQSIPAVTGDKTKIIATLPKVTSPTPVKTPVAPKVAKPIIVVTNTPQPTPKISTNTDGEFNEKLNQNLLGNLNDKMQDAPDNLNPNITDNPDDPLLGNPLLPIAEISQNQADFNNAINALNQIIADFNTKYDTSSPTNTTISANILSIDNAAADESKASTQKATSIDALYSGAALTKLSDDKTSLTAQIDALKTSIDAAYTTLQNSGALSTPADVSTLAVIAATTQMTTELSSLEARLIELNTLNTNSLTVSTAVNTARNAAIKDRMGITGNPEAAATANGFFSNLTYYELAQDYQDDWHESTSQSDQVLIVGGVANPPINSRSTASDNLTVTYKTSLDGNNDATYYGYNNKAVLQYTHNANNAKTTTDFEINKLANKYDYLRFGEWNQIVPSDKTQLNKRYMVFGQLTPASQVTALTGTATYSGKLVGSSYINNSHYDIAATTLTTVQFGPKTMETDITGATHSLTFGTGHADSEWTSAKITASFAGNAITGSLSDVYKDSTHLDGLYVTSHGAFFGPNAKNIGANFTAEGTVTSIAYQAAGTFAGEQTSHTPSP